MEKMQKLQYKMKEYKTKINIFTYCESKKEKDDKEEKRLADYPNLKLHNWYEKSLYCRKVKRQKPFFYST